MPGQLRPPLAGVGLVQLRVCISNPPLHVAEQVVLLTHSLQLPSIAHGSVLHATACADGPRHVAPPLAGAGLVHVRDCVSDPPPHFAEQVVVFDQDDHSPSPERA
jgi:hypothetical protein